MLAKNKQANKNKNRKKNNESFLQNQVRSYNKKNDYKSKKKTLSCFNRKCNIKLHKRNAIISLSYQFR